MSLKLATRPLEPNDTPMAISAAVLAHARQHAATLARPFIEVLEEQFNGNSAEFVQRLAHTFKYAFADMAQLRAANARFDILPFTECVQRGVFVFDAPDQCVVCAMTDPFDQHTLAWILRQCKSKLTLAVAHRHDISAILAHHEESMRAMQDMASNPTDASDDSAVVLDLSIASITEDSSAVVRLVNSTIYDALKLNASDIHLESDTQGMHVRYRVDGVLIEVVHITGVQTAAQVISRVKVLSDLDIAERRVPQDGRFKVRIKGADIDFRVSVIPSIYGEDAVLRLLDRRSLTGSESLRLESLGLDTETIRDIRYLATRSHGMLLVTGPTGSGKTTTLYAALTEINTGRDKIVTIEDPVEYRLTGVLQIPVNEKKGLTFARGLRSVLRHDPDTIMVGEIRDPETAQIAVQASLTGHLVCTSVHANSVFDVLSRFIHMAVDPYSLASALNGVVAQRLLRRNCPQCTTAIQPSDDALSTLELSTADVSGWSFRAGAGCGHCRGTGYKGRLAVAEVLVLDDHLRDLIATKAPLKQLKDQARARGMYTIRQRALARVAAGDTTLAEVARVAASV